VSVTADLRAADQAEDDFFRSLREEPKGDPAPVYAGELPTWYVESRTTPGRVYLVQRTGNGFTCTCEARGLCWHIRRCSEEGR
jgi:hypothetical protein